jgi:hypothetical protein
MTSLFEKLRSAQGVKMLCGMTLAYGDAGGAKRWFSAVPAAAGAKGVRVSDYVLLGLHYYGHILARYSKDESATYVLAGRLRESIYHIIEEGVWPGSDLVEFARVADLLEFRAAKEVPADVSAQIPVALIRPLLGDDVDMTCELPANATDDELILSVVALLQGLMPLLDATNIELLDKSLRYLDSYHNEEQNWTAPGAARNLANRAFRAAGGDVG